MSGIRLSEKHGVNPSLSQCFYCLKDKNEVLLFGHLPGDVEAPRKACINMEPCEECKGYMEKGIILISAKEDTDPKNPYRTGRWAVVSEAFVKRMLKPEKLVKHICECRFSFLSDDTWDLLGLPTDNEGNKP